MNPYKKKVLEARKKILKLTIEQEKQINNIYAKSATRLIDEILELPDISRTRVHDIDIARLLNDYTKDLYKQLYPNIKDNMMESSIIQRQVILDYVDQVVKDRKLSEIVKHNINNYSNTVVKNLVAGEYYKDGKTLSKRLWNLTSDNSNKIDEFIKMNIAGGANARKLANDLEVLINPKNRLTTTNFKAGFDSYKVSYQAQRLARTSITHAAAETQIQTAKKNPFNRGMKWNLSPSHGARMHGKQDECDDYAGNDSYGLGAGIFPADKTPIQHPNCMCYLTEWLVEIDDAIARINKWVEGNEDKELDEWSTEFNTSDNTDNKPGTEPIKVNGKDGKIDIKVPKNKTEQNYKKIETAADAKEVLVKDIGFKQIEESFDKVNDKLMINSTQQLKKLEDKFGIIHDSQYTICSASPRGRGGSDIIAYTSPGITNPTRGNLSLCPESFKNYESFIAEAKQSVINGWSMPTALNDYELSIHTVTHEYGHMLQHCLIQNEMEAKGWTSDKPNAFLDYKKKTPNAVMKWYNNISNKTIKQHYNEIIAIAEKNNPAFNFTDNISRYGKSDYEEFFAEVFMNSQLSKPNELGKAMIEWLDMKGLVKKETATTTNKAINKSGKEIKFELDGMKEDKKNKIISIITDLSNEYNTSLNTVYKSAGHVAGKVDISYNMYLNSSNEADVTHEFAHSLAMTNSDKLKLTNNKDFWKEIRKINKEYTKAYTLDSKKSISAYSHESIDEFMAEAFTQAKLKEKLNDTYGSDYEFAYKVLKTVDKYFKK